MFYINKVSKNIIRLVKHYCFNYRAGNFKSICAVGCCV